jgi:hypothetical protein
MGMIVHDGELLAMNIAHQAMAVPDFHSLKEGAIDSMAPACELLRNEAKPHKFFNLD